MPISKTQNIFVPERLKELRKRSPYSLFDCCNLLEIDENRYEKIENGELEPSCNEMGKMAVLFRVPTDYLMGANMDPDPAMMYSAVVGGDWECNDLGLRLIYLMEEAGESVDELALAMNKSCVTVYAWRGGRSMPDASSIIRLAQHFGCSADYLLGLSAKKWYIS